MKKIIAAADPAFFTEQQLIHFNVVSKQLNGNLVVVFLESLSADSNPLLSAIPGDIAPLYQELNWKNVEERVKLVNEKVSLFYEICRTHSIEATLHEATHLPLEALKEESRFADLLLLCNNTAFNRLFETDPIAFVKDALRTMQCPVLVLPEEQKTFNEIYFAYNGSNSSMYAIKEFTAQCSMLTDKKATIVYVDEKGDAALPGKELLTEYMNCHYTNWSTVILKGDASLQLATYLSEKNNFIVTLGAFGRSRLSEFFKESEAKKLLELLNNYLYITHP